MKLKNMLILTFLTLTIIPIMIITLLLYNSSLALSKESYTRNLTESLNVQADYISQAIETNMITDYRFANQTIAAKLVQGVAPEKSELHTAITAYLGTAQDKITVCMLLDKQHQQIYSIGDQVAVGNIAAQMPEPAAITQQTIVEFNLEDETHSIGIVTPVWEQDTYVGCLISVYDKSYIFKITSSYYKVADTSTYICCSKGDIVNSRQLVDENKVDMQTLLHSVNFATEGGVEAQIKGNTLSGYYTSIHNTPWYLVGFVDEGLIYAFANQFLPTYFLIILGVLLIDIALSIYFSRKVVKPLNGLIQVMEVYKKGQDGNELQQQKDKDYVEARYLRAKFFELMQKISLVQHNFEGIYQLYQSNNMSDTNIDIDVTKQTISSNKASFQALIDTVEPPAGACVVEKFTHCFCVKDQSLVLKLLEEMRDEHLSVTREIEVYTPYLDGKWFHTLVVPMYTNERLSRLYIQLRDISSFKKQELETNEQAKRDMLTGLYNRAGFVSCVGTVLHADARQLHALLFIDMDYFKMVNDNFGHTEGDVLLQAVGKTLLEAAGPNDIVSRFGGDEFAVFLQQTSTQAIAKMEQDLKTQLVYPYHTDQIDFVVTASIGVSTWQQDSPSTLEWLLQQADAAMYSAKRSFKLQKDKDA